MGRLTLSVVALFALVAPWGPTDRDTTVVNVDPQAHVDVVLPSGVGHKTTLSGRVVNAYGVPLRDVSVVADPLDSQGQVALRRGLATS